MKKFRLLVRVAVVSAIGLFASSSFALDAAYWLSDDTAWGEFGVAENWAIGEAESGVHAVPADTNFIKWGDKSKMFDLGGASYTVGGISATDGSATGNAMHVLSVTNGTLTVNGVVYNTLRVEAFNGGKVVFNTTNARSWGEYNGFYITVHGGGTVEERKSLTYQKYFVTIEEGGTYCLAPTTYGPHPTASNKDTVDNYGTFCAPNGIKRNYTWESTPSSPCPGTYYRQHKGVFKLGGPVVRGTQPYQPLVFEFNGGTLEATNDVSFTLSAIDSAKFMEGSAMTVKVDANSSLDLKNVTFADDATITKTGWAAEIFIPYAALKDFPREQHPAGTTAAGAFWLGNFCRGRHWDAYFPKAQRREGSRPESTRRYTRYSIWNKDPAAFGKLQFVE